MNVLRIGLFLMFLAPGVCLAQATDDPKAWAEKFLDIMVAKGPEKAQEFLKENSEFGAGDANATKRFQRSMEAAKARYGEAIGFELLDQDEVGKSLLKLEYLLRFKSYPLRLDFFFYKPTSAWNLVSAVVGANVWRGERFGQREQVGQTERGGDRRQRKRRN